MSGSTVTNGTRYEPGVWDTVGGSARYLHSDHLGTLRITTNASGVAGIHRVFTAFGERIDTTPVNRFGYVGAHGYQAHAEFTYLHVGARYYDPASGRFLQRDPIGIRGGLNVYSYIESNTVVKIDPEGLQSPADRVNCQDECDKWVPAPTCTGQVKTDCINSCGDDYWPPTSPPRPGFKPWAGLCPPTPVPSTPSPSPGPPAIPRPSGSCGATGLEVLPLY